MGWGGGTLFARGRRGASPVIMHVAGARPNFMKVAPLMGAIRQAAASGGMPAATRQVLVHTGQHYDRALSELFFEELGLPKPDFNLGIGSGSHGQQTGRIMEAFEPVLVEERPDLVVVVGDVNSSLACALDAKKMNIPVAHVEAGLRSGDRSMPEEINRLATDAVSDLLFTTDRIANANLEREGHDPATIHFVGNVMIDTLLAHRDAALARPTLSGLGGPDSALVPGGYVLVTLHRPGNVDDARVLRGIGGALAEIGARMPVVFPVHPRTRTRIEAAGLGRLFSIDNGIRLIAPQGYLDFINLTAHAAVVLTDSGGIQEETTILGVPCLTLRPNTERPVTVDAGTNRVIGNDPAAVKAAMVALEREPIPDRRPERWDGHAAERITGVLAEWFGQRLVA